MPKSKAILSDCIDGMRKLQSECIDLTVTSPPYDNLRTYNGYSFDWKETICQLQRITKPGGVVVWIVNDQTINGSETGTSFRQALYAMDVGFNLHDTMIWAKDSCPFPESTRYSPVFEYMFVWSKGKPKSINLIRDKPNIYAGAKWHGTERQKDGKLIKRHSALSSLICSEYGYRHNVWYLPSEKNNKTGHPAVFPLQLAQDHITSWSNEGDTVLDPFLGSGTTRIAAYDLNRNFIGYEIDKEYFERQEKRFQEYVAQMSLFVCEEKEEENISLFEN